MSRMTLIPCFGIIAACASPSRQLAQSPSSPSPEQATQTERPRAEAEARKAPSPAPVPPELERLVRSVRALEDATEDPEHHRLTRSLRDAADALEQLEPDRVGVGAALRTAAERIEASGANSNNHADELRTALAAARDFLRAQGARAQRLEALDGALAEFGRGVEALSASRPLLEQRRVVGDSFRALTDAVFLAAGQEAPFVGRAPTPRSVADVLAQARADVLALGRADLSNIRKLTSRAMYSMAELVEAVAGRGLAAREVAEIRAEARRLEHDAGGPFARAGWVERGLQTALGALDELEACRETLLATWTDAARRATATLPDRGALPFQHAAVQDAFRSTLDAFGAAVLDRESCQTAVSGRDHASAAGGRTPGR